MDQVNVNIRMDRELKEAWERDCRELGLNITTAITMLAKKMTREHCIPFEVSYDPYYTESDIARLVKAKADLEAGKGTEHDIIEVDE